MWGSELTENTPVRAYCLPGVAFASLAVLVADAPQAARDRGVMLPTALEPKVEAP
eukprot:CAMPEP_0179962792 /NCGR_PEP_ID=MMETSP0983-20121128/30413_1 /TAXON_ID=483367 /ORGANISM="non described non described, Strain CCMP 2436" /LENGTH=54 /DNA_ID=CAMNT_0021875333 /DNA_START=78 /DNA_END=243 /DNA_ORIENTATION=+